MFLYGYSPHNRKVVTHKTTSIVIVKNVIKKSEHQSFVSTKVGKN
jgi:hypothetical protein